MADYKILTIPFARDATPDLVNDIPDDASVITPESASWKNGFPYVTMIPLVAGGIPPQGQDFNGILSALSEHIVYQNGGGIYTFSQEYVDKTGGYDKDSVLIGDDGSALWVSLSDNNTENFNTTAPPTEWIKIGSVNSVQTSGDQTIEGIKTFSSFPVTPSAAPTDDYQAANKKYVDDRIFDLHPSMTGSITLNGTTDNAVVMADIVTELALEIGDVIRIDAGAYNKLHTVESITDNSSIIVNYEHAGNRGNGSLKLPDFTGQATVTRIAKWFNAPIGLGQAWVNFKGKRINDAVLLNNTNRVISVSAYAALTISSTLVLYLGGNSSTGEQLSRSGANLSATHAENVYGNVGIGDSYAVYLNDGNFSDVMFWELR